jgi:membrane protein
MLNVARLVVERARKEKLPQVAGSLTLTTLLSIVPLLALSFALLTHLPMFGKLQGALERDLLKGSMPGDIAGAVLSALHHFAVNARGLTWVGTLLLPAAGVLLFLAIENALNQMWQVRKKRPLARRVGLVLVMLLVGPPLLGLVLWATSVVWGASLGLLGTLPRGLRFLLDVGPVVLAAVAMSALFRYVPNTRVAWRDAAVGGVMASVAFELGRRGFTAYLVKLPTYRTVYGAFAALPLFVLWTYFSWLVTLVAALVAASLDRGARRPAGRQRRG